MYNASHGYYMCYRSLTDGKVYEKFGAAAEVPQKNGAVDSEYCGFSPVHSASFYVVYAVGGGGGGSSSIGGAPGEFMTLFVTNIADNLKIYPGVAGSKNNPGGLTKILNNEDKEILSVKGGLAGGESRIQQKYIRECTVVPLASFINDSASKSYINASGSNIKCEVTDSAVIATMCPRSNDDIVQDKEIIKFYSYYSRVARSFYVNPANTDYNYCTKKAGVCTAPNEINVYRRYVYNDDCIEGYPMYGATDGYYKYCKNDDVGDKLYKKAHRTTAASQYTLVGTKSTDCKKVTMYYNTGDDLKINAESDSNVVVRTKDNFKFILDMYYDMSRFNNTKYIKPSGFGEYITNSALKDDTTAVLFDKTADAKLRTSDIAAKQFEPSMGDGGHSGFPGYPGAVFIAW